MAVPPRFHSEERTTRNLPLLPGGEIYCFLALGMTTKHLFDKLLEELWKESRFPTHIAAIRGIRVEHRLFDAQAVL